MKIGVKRIGSPGDPYLDRYIFGRARVHVIYRGDREEAPHSHPWDFWTFPLRSYVEVVMDPKTQATRFNTVKAWRLHYRPASYAHKICDPARPVVTLVWVGRKAHGWGFWKMLWPSQRRVLVDWREYLGIEG